MKQIRLTQGEFAIVDDEDFERLSKFKWHISKRGNKRKHWYAERLIREKGKNIRFNMHRVLLDVPNGMEIDHRNGNGLDNRKCNLRICTRSQNQANSTAHGGSSKYKGVCWHRRDKIWESYIQPNGKMIYLGSFDSEVEAARAYNKAAVEHFGEFANINLIA